MDNGSVGGSDVIGATFSGFPPVTEKVPLAGVAPSPLGGEC